MLFSVTKCPQCLFGSGLLISFFTLSILMPAAFFGNLAAIIVEVSEEMAKIGSKLTIG